MWNVPQPRPAMQLSRGPAYQVRMPISRAYTSPAAAYPFYRKDKTMVEILERVKNLEEHMQRLGSKLEGAASQPSNPVFSPLSVPPNNFAHPEPGILGPTHPAASFHLSDPSLFNLGGEDQYKYVSSVHEMLGWPAISQLLSSVQPKVPNHDLSSSERDGVAIMLSSTATFFVIFIVAS